MLGRAIIVWLLILVLAVLNGAVRDLCVAPALGETLGRGLSSIILSALVVLATFVTIGWIRPSTVGVAWGVGGLWVALTLAFEFGAGHYALGKRWSELLADYNVLRGRIWLLVLVVTLLSPPWTARLRHVVRP